MDYKDYYKTMGVDKDATPEQIKRAYRKLARKYHPDVSSDKNADEKFKALGEAYEVLKDPEKKAAYDTLGDPSQAQQQGFQRPPNWQQNFSQSSGNSAQFSDFFEDLFGQNSNHFQQQYSGATQPPRQGEDQHAKLHIDLNDAFTGATRNLNLQHSEYNAAGVAVNKNQTLKVKIPKGIKAGQNIRLKGKGNSGTQGAKAGDLYLEVEFNPHPFYKVDDADILLDLPITPWEAALGAKINVPTPSGTVKLALPSGTSSGKKMRLKGKGIPSKTAGDLIVTLTIILPDTIDEQQKQLYQQLQKLDKHNPRATLGVA